jgi:hypothetical protein
MEFAAPRNKSLLPCVFLTRPLPAGRQQLTGQSPEDDAMSRETPKDDPRQRTDEGSLKQTDEPWKGNPEKEQRSSVRKDDLERWQRTNTH